MFDVLISSFVGLCGLYLLLLPVYNRLFLTRFDPKGKHCYVTGGSQGLGKAVGVLLAKRGAHVTIVARRQDILDEALKEIKSARASPSQRCFAVSASVTTFESASAAVDTATELQGGALPEYVFCCAGAARPMSFLEQPVKGFEEAMQLNYFGTLYTVKHVVQKMFDSGIHGRIVLTGSTAGYLGFLGYAEYTPTKAALRGLAECLRHELLLYDISVHYYAPGTILTPGLENENKTKPKITRELEGTNDAQTAEECADGLFNGLAKNNFMISTDFVGDLSRASMRGAAPLNNVVYDYFLTLLAGIVFGPVRLFADWLVYKEKRRLRHLGKSA